MSDEELFDKIIGDSNQIEVSDAAQIFLYVFVNYFDCTETGARVKAKISDKEFASLLDGMTHTYLCTLYVNGAKDEKEQDERLQETKEVLKNALINEVNKRRAKA